MRKCLHILKILQKAFICFLLFLSPLFSFLYPLIKLYCICSSLCRPVGGGKATFMLVSTKSRRRDALCTAVSKQKICQVFETSRISFKRSLFTKEDMHSDQQEEQKFVKIFIEDYSENWTDPVKQEETKEQRGWCLLSS